MSTAPDPRSSHEMEGKAELQGITSIEAQENNEYITGFKLFAVTSGVSIVGLLLLLDMSIISTVEVCALKSVSRILRSSSCILKLSIP